MKKNYTEELLKYVDKDKLPAIFGGDCSCENVEGGCMCADIGPWSLTK